jgi:hypothetical protein
MSDELIRVETKEYYRREDGAITMVITEKTFLGWENGEEIWQTKTTSIPLF